MIKENDWMTPSDWNLSSETASDRGMDLAETWEKELSHILPESDTEAAQEQTEHAEDLWGEFREFSSEKLSGGLVMERYTTGDAPDVTDTLARPEDYTSNPCIVEGLRSPGQVQPEMLTDAALKYMSGDPVKDIPLWRIQQDQNSCAIASQSFVLRSEIDSDITETELILESYEQSPCGGCRMAVKRALDHLQRKAPASMRTLPLTMR